MIWGWLCIVKMLKKNSSLCIKGEIWAVKYTILENQLWTWTNSFKLVCIEFEVVHFKMWTGATLNMVNVWLVHSCSYVLFICEWMLQRQEIRSCAHKHTRQDLPPVQLCHYTLKKQRHTKSFSHESIPCFFFFFPYSLFTRCLVFSPMVWTDIWLPKMDKRFYFVFCFISIHFISIFNTTTHNSIMGWNGCMLSLLPWLRTYQWSQRWSHPQGHYSTISCIQCTC